TIPNTKGYYNEKIGTNGEPSQTVQEGIASGKYTVTSVTVNGKTMSLNDYKTEVADGTLNAANGENNVVYNVTENEGKVEVTLQIQGPDGTIQKVLISNKQVQDAPVGTPIAGANYSDISNMVPAGYHLIKTTVDNKPLLENNKPGTTIGGDVVPGITHVVYTIAKDSMSSTTVTYQTPDGTVVPGGTTTPIVVPGGTPQTVTITPPPGYKLVPKNPVSDNGTNVTPNKDGKIDVNTGTPEQGKDNHIIVIVQKIVQNTVKVQVQNPDGTVVPITSDNAGNYEGGSNLTPQTSIDGVDGASAVTKDGTPLTTPVAPKGYHIVKVVNELGSTATTETDNYKVPGTLGKENNSTTYTIAPNSATLDVSVNLVNSKNEVVSQLEKPTTTIPSTKGYYNEKIGTNGEPSQTVQEGIASGKYTVTSVTVNG
ncbi:MAG: hypothetical protein ACRC57_15390, partial [Sarcina sp.]